MEKIGEGIKGMKHSSTPPHLIWLVPACTWPIASHVPAVAHTRTVASHIRSVTPAVSSARSDLRSNLADFKLKIDPLLSHLCPQITDLILKGLSLFGIGVG